MTETDQTLLKSFVTGPSADPGDAGAAESCPDGIPGLLDLPHAPRRILCGDIDIRIDRNGLWYYAGSPIGRKELVKLFATVLHKDRQGGYWLATPAELGRIHVADVPFMAVEVNAQGTGVEQCIRVRTNLDMEVEMDDVHPLRIDLSQNGEPFPYVMIERGLEARLARSCFYHLVEMGEHRDGPDGSVFGVWSHGRFFAIGSPE